MREEALSMASNDTSGSAESQARGTPPSNIALLLDPVASAKEAGLRYVRDDRPGIRRKRCGKGFRFFDPQGIAVRSTELLRRIASLAIPPAWTDVWICPDPNGHLQATGRDDRGRKQYRYHPRWRATRDETKFDHAIAFAQALPRIRARVEADLAQPGLPRTKVLAAVVCLLERTHIRVGNEEYARQNGSFGLTTLRNRHVRVSGHTVRFNFRGKAGVEHDIRISDRRLARIVERCQDLPGQELFEYLDDDGTVRSIDSSDVNDYIREVAGEEFRAKDFRIWAGTVLAARALLPFDSFESETQARRNVVRAIELVANQLGNTRAVCKKCYVHPTVIDTYMHGALRSALSSNTNDESNKSNPALSPEEEAVLALLHARAAGVLDGGAASPL
jgi:DNA topoisomerase-1